MFSAITAILAIVTIVNERMETRLYGNQVFILPSITNDRWDRITVYLHDNSDHRRSSAIAAIYWKPPVHGDSSDHLEIITQGLQRS